MNNYNSIPNKYNRLLILILMFSPLIGYITLGIFHKDFETTLTIFSYIGIFLILFYGNKKNPIKFPMYLWFYLLFIFYVYFSTFFMLDRDFKMIYLYKNRLVGAFNLLFIIENVFINRKYYHFIFKWSKIILVIAVLVIIVQQVYSSNFFMREDFIDPYAKKTGNEDRLLSIYSWATMLGNGLSFVPVYLIMVENLNKKKQNKKVLLWIVLGISYAVLTKSRWIMVNALMVFLVIIVTHKYKFRQFLKYLTIIPIIFLLSYITLNSIGINVEGIVKDRIFESDKKLDQSTASTRILAFSAFNKFYWKNAIFGKGNIKYGMGGTGKQDYELKKFLAGRSSQIHVGYLSLFYMYGAVGGIFFLLFIFLLLKKMYKDAKKTQIWSPFFGILGFAIANLTLVTFSFLEMGLIFAILSSKYYTKQHRELLKLTKAN